MKEIEILVQLHDEIDLAKSKLVDGFKFTGTKQTIDKYYFDPLRKNLHFIDGKLSECFRIREKGNNFYLTYKVDHYNGPIWNYSDEFESEFSDIKAVENIVSKLGFEPLVTINSKKQIFVSDEFEVVLEEVEMLGNFLEVEFQYNDAEIDVDKAKEKIGSFIKSLSLNIGPELNSGKPELLLLKQSNKN